MSEAIFEIEAVRKRALELMAKEVAPLTTGQVALKLQVPYYAVDAALESAHLAKLARFTAGVGWVVAPAERKPLDDSGQFQRGLV